MQFYPALKWLGQVGTTLELDQEAVGSNPGFVSDLLPPFFRVPVLSSARPSPLGEAEIRGALVP